MIDGDRVLGAVMVFRDVTGEKRVQKQLELADRLASLGTMAAGVAHEVNNPLAVVVSNATFAAEELRRCLDELAAGERLPAREIRERLDEVALALDDVESAGLRIARVVEDLRTFSRPPARTSDRANVIRAVEWATRATAVELRHRAQLVTRLDPVPAVEGEESRLAQVFVNLLINAAHAIAPGDAKHNQVSVTTGPTNRCGRWSRSRHRRRHSGRDPRPHLRAVLHHQAVRRRHRARPAHLQRDHHLAGR